MITKKLTYILWIFAGALLVIVLSAGWIFRGTLTHIIARTPFGIETVQPVQVGQVRRSSYETLKSEVETLIEDQHYSLAALKLGNLLRERPDEESLYDLLAEIHLRTNDAQKLEALSDMLSRKFPESPRADILKVQALIAQQKFAEAQTFLEEKENLVPELQYYGMILADFQNNTARSLELREALLEEDDVPEELFLRVEAIDSVLAEFDQMRDAQRPHRYALLSKTLADQNQYILARSYADLAIKEDIAYIDAWVLRGYALFLLGDYEAAESDLRHAYELDPLRAQTQYFLGLVLYERGNVEEAVLYFEKALKQGIESATDIRWKLVDIYTKLERYEDVMNLYRELLEESEDPEAFSSALHLAIDVLKEPETALEFTTNLVQRNDKDVFALNIHAWALIANKQYSRAEEVLTQAQNLEKNNPRTYLNWGLLYEEQEKFSQAIESYKKAYDLAQELSAPFVANLAAEKHNLLLNRDENPEEPESPSRPANSP